MLFQRPLEIKRRQDQNNFNKIAEIQKDVDEIKVQMKENIKKQVDSMEDVNKLEEKSANLKMQTADYANNANTLKKVTWWQNCKLTIIIAVIIIAIVLKNLFVSLIFPLPKIFLCIIHLNCNINILFHYLPLYSS